MDNMQVQARLLRMTEVAQLTGLSRAKAYAMVASGELPSLRAGRSVRVPLAALERWIVQNTTGGGIEYWDKSERQCLGSLVKESEQAHVWSLGVIGTTYQFKFACAASGGFPDGSVSESRSKNIWR